MLTKLPDQISAQDFIIDDFRFTPVGFEAKADDLDFDRWQRIGEFIRLTNVASQWWWGDWLNMGEDAFGEKSSQALEVTRWDEETLRVYSWVCRQVPTGNRLTGVPFSHYLALAKLPVKQQLKWAKKVSAEQWSRAQLKRALRSEEQDAEPMQLCVLVRCDDDDAVGQVKSWASLHGYEAERCERARNK